WRNFQLEYWRNFQLVSTLKGHGRILKSRLIRKLEKGERDIYEEYVSFRCYKGKVILSIERRRKAEFALFYIP
ncbi:hypothetical protein DWV27_19360, partial [Phocaeicola vulgatus]